MLEQDDEQNDNNDSLLEILNEVQPVEEYGPDINGDVSNSVNKLFAVRYPKNNMDKIKDQYKIPNNCKSLRVPKVNKEIWHLLPQRTRQNDFSWQTMQHNVALASIISTKLAEKIFIAAPE